MLRGSESAAEEFRGSSRLASPIRNQVRAPRECALRILTRPVVGEGGNMIESIAAVFVAGSIPVARAVDMVALRVRAYADERVLRR